MSTVQSAMSYIEWDWLLNVTCNDISVIYVTANTCTGGLKNKLNRSTGGNWTYGRASDAIDISNGSLTCLSEHGLGPPFVWLFRETAHFSRLLRHARDTDDLYIYSHLNYSLCSQPGGNSWRLGSISHTGTSMMFCPKTTQSLRITWVRCIPLNSRLKTWQLLLSWIVCLTSQLTIFQSYMWRHIDVQADWRRSMTYGRAPNAIDIS